MKHERRDGVKEIKKTARLKKIITALLTASVVAFLAVFFAFVPFRLLLPPYDVPPRGEGEMRLHFLPLRGGVTIVEFPDGEVLAVNAGDGTFTSDNVLCRYLRSLDVASLSVLAVSSASDRVGGMPALFEAFQVKKTYLPAHASDSGAYARFLSAAEKEECEKEKLVRYCAIANGSGAYAVCLSPYSNEEDASEEDASAVLFLSYAGVNILLSGDITSKRENRLAEEYELAKDIFDSGEYRVRLDETDILLAPDHAADGGLGEAWLSLLSPKSTVVCCNETEVPSDGALRRLAAHSDEILRTDELGAVMITIKDGAYRIQTHMTE